MYLVDASCIRPWVVLAYRRQAFLAAFFMAFSETGA